MNLDIKSKITTFINNSKHVMNISYRPTAEEFRRSAKVIILGILVIGVSGFIIGVILTLLVNGTLPAI